MLLLTFPVCFNGKVENTELEVFVVELLLPPSMLFVSYAVDSRSLMMGTPTLGLSMLIFFSTFNAVNCFRGSTGDFTSVCEHNKRSAIDIWLFFIIHSLFT